MENDDIEMQDASLQDFYNNSCKIFVESVDEFLQIYSIPDKFLNNINDIKKNLLPFIKQIGAPSAVGKV